MARVKGPAKTYIETGIAPTSERSEGGASRMFFAEREMSRSACRLHRSTPPAQVPRGLFFSTLCRTFQQGHLRGRRRDQTSCSPHQNWLRWLGTGRLGGGRLIRRTVVTSIFHHQHAHPTVAHADVMCASTFFFSASDGRLDKRVRIARICDVRRWRRPLPTTLCLGRRWVRTPWGSLAALAALANGQAALANGQTAAAS